MTLFGFEMKGEASGKQEGWEQVDAAGTDMVKSIERKRAGHFPFVRCCQKFQEIIDQAS